MAAPLGNQNAAGEHEPGSGRKSAYQERTDADFLWDVFLTKFSKAELEELLKERHSIKDAWLAKSYSGNERFIGQIVHKLFPDKIEQKHSGSVQIEINGEGIYIHALRSPSISETSIESTDTIQSDSVRTEMGQDNVSSQSADIGSVSK